MILTLTSLMYFVLFRFFQRLTPCIGHQTPTFEVSTTTAVQFGPMTCRTARREPLYKTTIGQPFQRRINPPEAQSLFNNVQIWQCIPLWAFRAINNHPTTTLRKMVFREPTTQLGSLGNVQKIYNLHSSSQFDFHTKLVIFATHQFVTQKIVCTS